jgi:hypothetical protein
MLSLLSLTLVTLSASASLLENQEAAMKEATLAFRGVNLDDLESRGSATVKRLEARGLTEKRLLALLEGLHAVCLNEEGRTCEIKNPSKRDEARLKYIQAVFDGLGAVGTHEALPLLWRLSGHGVSEAAYARVRIYEQDMVKHVATHKCAPPSAKEIKRMRETLDDFVVIRPKEMSLTLDRPTSKEVDDLAYFLAAIDEAGPPIDESAAQHGSWIEPGQTNVTRDDLFKQMKDGQSRGNHLAMREAGRSYLKTMGFPVAFRGKGESAYSWGGARYSEVMRDLADADESEGDDEEAATLYRLANPGGGACGAGVDGVWQKQIAGLIRAAEKTGHCRAVVPERLLNLDSYAAANGLYGTRRLHQAGFDVARLYRGALVTAYRDIDEQALRQIFLKDPTELGQLALGRLNSKGPDAFENRVYALEGWAEVAKKDAIVRLTAMARAGLQVGEGSSPVFSHQRRALVVLGELFRRPPSDPCRQPRRNGLFDFVGFSSAWHRKVDALEGCGNVLTKAERDSLSEQLLPQLQSDDMYLRARVAETLGAIASPVSLSALNELVNRQYKDGQVCLPFGDGAKACHSTTTERRAAREAIERIRSFDQAQ